VKIEVLDSADAAARRTAEFIAYRARQEIEQRGRFIMALSGGAGPWQAFRMLALEEVPWRNVHVVQVDERVAPDGHADRNWTHLQHNLLSRVPIPAAHLHPMPVTADDLDSAAARYTDLLRQLAGAPPELDLVHLGLGTDGHTASLIPGDAVLEAHDAEVAVTAQYRGRRRMTLTLPAINRAHCIVWLVTGETKANVLARLLAGDTDVPAARIRHDHALLLVDREAARDVHQ
jgi:6-phosphogluconolactonase